MLAMLPLPPHAAHRRDELQALYQQLDKQVDRLDDRVKHAAAQRPRATELTTHPGVGHVTALRFGESPRARRWCVPNPRTRRPLLRRAAPRRCGFLLRLQSIARPKTPRMRHQAACRR